jgi:hypothetical protein
VPRLADEIAVELEVLSQSPSLLPLVAEELGDGGAATIRASVGVISGRSDTSRSPLSMKL